MIKKLISIIIIAFVLFTTTTSVSAEAGLSEAGRMRYFKISDTSSLQVLPGGEGADGEDYLMINKYEKSFLGSIPLINFCVPEYKQLARVADLNAESYIQYPYIFNNKQIIDVQAGTVLADWKNPDEYDEIKLELNLDEVSSQKLNLSYIEKEFEEIDMNDLKIMGCFVIGYLVAQLVIFAGIIIGTIYAIKYLNKKFKKN